MTHDEVRDRFLGGHDDTITEVCGLFAARSGGKWHNRDVTLVESRPGSEVAVREMGLRFQSDAGFAIHADKTGYSVIWWPIQDSVETSVTVRPSHPRLVAAALDALREDPVRCALRAYRNHAVATRRGCAA